MTNMMTALTCNLKHVSVNSCDKFDNVMAHNLLSC